MKEFLLQLFGDGEVITTATVLVQSVGWLALICSAISFQQKKRLGILLWQATATLVSSAYLFLLGAYAGAVLDLLGFVAKLSFSKEDCLLGIPLSVWRVVFLLLMLVAGLMPGEYILECIQNQVTIPWGDLFTITWNSINLFSILATLASCLSLLALSMKSPTKIRVISLFVGPCWIVYNWHFHAYPSILMECIALTSIMIAIIRYDIRKKKENKI